MSEAIRSRRSIRKYERKQIPKRVLEELLDSMRLAPSASNRQMWHVIVVTDDRSKEELASASGNQRFVGECSAYLVGISEPGVHYSTVDLTIALDHLTLRAVEMGLGTCWIGDFEPDKIRELLDIPEDREVAICMTLGYPAQKPSARKRRQLSELFMGENWSNPWA